MLSKEQQYAFQKYTQGQNLFITGPGGTGKTKLISHIVQHANAMERPIQVCAMTGCAATLLGSHARTIHSWAGIGIAKGPREKIVKSALTKNRCKKMRKTRILIVDEVSMMSVKVFEIVEEIVRAARKQDRMFGGLQVIFTGDFFQLPPISTAGEPDTERFCFESEKWRQVFPIENHIELKTMFRQKDPLYISILHDIRKGKMTPEHKQVLAQYVHRPMQKGEGDIVPVKIYPLKSRVDAVNTHMFGEIQAEEYVYVPVIEKEAVFYTDTGCPIPKEVLDECAKLTQTEVQREIDYMLNNTTGLKEELKLKKGCSVMCTSNLDLEQGICNGLQGVVTGFTTTRMGRMPNVRFVNGVEMVMHMHSWQSDDYPVLVVKQIPLMLSWAMTIHKIQGATLSMAEMDIGRSIFEYGQVYVALSRVQSLDGLYLVGFDPAKIRANPKVLAFYDQIPDIPEPLQKNTIEDILPENSKTLGFEEYAYSDPEDISVKKINTLDSTSLRTDEISVEERICPFGNSDAQVHRFTEETSNTTTIMPSSSTFRVVVVKK